uniref:Capsid-like protein n=1 Tax=Ecklonia radiata-associated virus 2 TaxID=2480192 RepID=A0A3G2CHR7_9CIRC|nr:capsid-like protein [Ecklonia radiata-associated virus 2]
MALRRKRILLPIQRRRVRPRLYKKKTRTYRRSYGTRRMRRMQDFSPRAIANPVGVSNAKTRLLTFSQDSPDRAFVPYIMTNIPFTAANAPDSRQRNIINIRGFKIQVMFQNTQRPAFYLNWAVIHPKLSIDNTSVSTQDFFRTYNANRAVDLITDNTGVVNNIAQDVPTHGMSSINTDKWVVLKHKRTLLAGAINNPDDNALTFTATNCQIPKGNRVVIDKYIKMGRQFRFPNDDSTFPEGGNTIFCYWLTNLNNYLGSQNTSADVSVVRTTGRIITYFRETKN